MSSTVLNTEHELLTQLASGEESAFSLIIARYATPIHTQLMIYLKDAHLAEEIMQDIFMVVWRYREKLATIENFAGYLYVITRNRIKKELKEKVFATIEPPEDKLHELLTPSETNLEFKELLSAVHDGIDKLPPKRQMVFRLSRLQGLTHEEIALQLDISKNTVKEHIKEALAFLRSYLKDNYGELMTLAGCCWLLAY